jgi:hypothetical protein
MKLIDYEADFDRFETASRVYELNGISVKGTRNKKEKNINQDAFLIKVKQNVAFIVVADGLGSCKNSGEGARLAVACLEEWIEKDLSTYSPSDEMITILNHKLVDRWKLKITKGNFKDYDTTLLYAIVVNNSLIVGGIGDGMIICQMNNHLEEFSLTKNEFTNTTVSIASKNAKDFMKGKMMKLQNENLPLTIIVTTDGISEDLNPNNKALLPKYLYNQLRDTDIIAVQEEIEKWVTDWKTENHTDDRTFCMLNIYRKE